MKDYSKNTNLSTNDLKSSTDQSIAWFRASTRYINSHRGCTFVIAIDGEVFYSSYFQDLIADLLLLKSIGVRLILVHGARPQISETYNHGAIEVPNDENMTITRKDEIDAISGVVGTLSSKIDAMFLSGRTAKTDRSDGIRLIRGNFLVAKPLGVKKGIDFQQTGKVRHVEVDLLHDQLDSGCLLLQSNIGYSVTGELFNLCEIEIATEIAISLKAEKMIVMTRRNGVTDAQGHLIAHLSPNECVHHMSRMKGSENEEERFFGKQIEYSARAVESGVSRTHMISHASNGTLIRELFTPEGCGTLISKDDSKKLRKGRISDAAEILNLIRPLEESGLLINRSKEFIESEINNFRVIDVEGEIVACAALHLETETTAEVSCIATSDQYRNKGLGKKLLSSLESQAKKLGVTQIFVLTTGAAHWFIENEFTETSLDSLPKSRQLIYDTARKSKIFIKNI